MKCYLADASIDQAPEVHSNFSFDKKYLGSSDEPPFITLSSWVEDYEPSSNDLILQMDIEGDEYEVLFVAGGGTPLRVQ